MDFVGPDGFGPPQDRDGDGYVSRFLVEMRFDSQCYGEYDDGTLFDDPPFDPALELYLNDGLTARILNFEEFSASGREVGPDIVITLEPEREFYRQFARGSIDVRVEYYDNDPPHESIIPAQKVDTWEGILRWEPLSDDRPRTTTTRTPRTTETPRTTTTTASPTPDERYELDMGILGNGTILVGTGDEEPTDLFNNVTQQEAAGSEVSLEAVPDDGYEFSHWSGTQFESLCDRYSPKLNFTLTNDTSITAHFVEEGTQRGIQSAVLQANASPGQNRTVTVSVTAAAPNASVLAPSTLNVTGIPESWTVVNESASSGGTWFPEATQWFWRTTDRRCLQGTVTFQRPADASVSEHAIETTFVPPDGTPVQTNVTVSVGTPFAVELTEVSPGTPVTPGETVNLTYTVTNRLDTSLQPATLQLVSLPENITVVDRSASDGQWSPDARMWLWPSIDANETVTVSVTLRVPSSIDEGTYEIVANAEAGDGLVATQRYELNVSTTGTETRDSPELVPLAQSAGQRM